MEKFVNKIISVKECSDRFF